MIAANEGYVADAKTALDELVTARSYIDESMRIAYLLDGTVDGANAVKAQGTPLRDSWVQL